MYQTMQNFTDVKMTFDIDEVLDMEGPLLKVYEQTKKSKNHLLIKKNFIHI